MREISPTSFGCVPAAFGALAAALERDADLRQRFFKNMRSLGYGGALLPQPIWERMQHVAVQEIGEQLPFGTGWGMTETTATGVAVYWNTKRTGLLGLPQPGSTAEAGADGRSDGTEDQGSAHHERLLQGGCAQCRRLR